MSGALAQEAETLARAAIASVDVFARTFSALPRLPPARARVVVVAIGKAAPTMARAAIDRWGPRIARMLVITTDGTSTAPLDGIVPPPEGLDVMFAPHPLPDARSVVAAEAALSAVAGQAKDLALVLVSGGASPLVCAPVSGMTLDDERALLVDLHASGAPITAINLVRRHLSRIRGGGLARAALPGRTLTLVVSDVLVSSRAGHVEGARPIDVGSGPGTPDDTTIDDARAALRRFAPRRAEQLEPLLQTAFPAAHLDAHRTRSRIVASPFELADAARAAVEAAGYATRVVPPSLDDVDTVARETLELARGLSAGSACVRVAEPAVVLPDPARRGRGGRAGRLALTVWSQGLPDDVAFACLASDGVDGSGGGAGAVVSGVAPPGAERALEAFDDAPFLAQHGALVAARPTGTNLLDVHVLLRRRA